MTLYVLQVSFFYKHNIYVRAFCSKLIFFLGSMFFQDISWFCKILGTFQAWNILQVVWQPCRSTNIIPSMYISLKKLLVTFLL